MISIVKVIAYRRWKNGKPNYEVMAERLDKRLTDETEIICVTCNKGNNKDSRIMSRSLTATQIKRDKTKCASCDNVITWKD